MSKIQQERIKQLAEQAVQLVADKHTKGDVSRLNTDSYQVKDLIQQKFAELIIQDCVSQIAMIGISNFENDDVSWTVDKSIENIRTHFGIEK